MKFDREEIRQKIRDEIEKTKKDVEDLREQTKPISPENSLGRLSRLDAINNKSINEESLRKAEDKLKKLESALERVDDPDFGICIKCGQPIPVGRLMLMPHTKKCVNCA